MKNQKYFLSLNRFESRKNINLALQAYANSGEFFISRGVKLIIAGGLDQRSHDSSSTYEKLQISASLAGFGDYVELKANIGEEEKAQLIR